MSDILKNLLEPGIRSTLRSFGSNDYSGGAPTTGTGAQDQLVDRLSTAIAEAVQQYLASNVTVLPGQAVATSTGAGSTVSPGILNAP
jgi:hypothetical protein